MARACSTATARGDPGQKTKPIASAPALRGGDAVLDAGDAADLDAGASHVVGPVQASGRTTGRQRRRQFPSGVVFRAGEMEPVRRERRRRARAVAAGEELADPRGRVLARADVHQRADDVADHVMEERIGGEIEADVLAGRRDRDGRQRPGRRLRLALRRAERGKVVRADQRARGLASSLPTSSARWYQPTRPARSAGRTGPAARAGRCSGAGRRRNARGIRRPPAAPRAPPRPAEDSN